MSSVLDRPCFWKSKVIEPGWLKRSDTEVFIHFACFLSSAQPCNWLTRNGVTMSPLFAPNLESSESKNPQWPQAYSSRSSVRPWENSAELDPGSCHLFYGSGWSSPPGAPWERPLLPGPPGGCLLMMPAQWGAAGSSQGGAVIRSQQLQHFHVSGSSAGFHILIRTSFIPPPGSQDPLYTSKQADLGYGQLMRAASVPLFNKQSAYSASSL